MPEQLVPSQSDFNEGEYLNAPELEALATHLIGQYEPFSWIPTLRIAYLWKRKATKSRGEQVAGQVQRTPKLLRHFVTAEYVVWLGADYFDGLEIRHKEIEQTMWHALCHFHKEEKLNKKEPDKPKIKITLTGHDVELFFSEMKKYPDGQVKLA